MKKRGLVALLSHFVFLGALAIPALVLAKSARVEVTRVPETAAVQNSQIMPLLAGYLNTNPTSIGGPIVAIVDDTTLSPTSEDASAYVESGQSGTGQISIYTVRDGDTIGSIAAMFNVSANTIRWANDLKGNTLRVGQDLVILPISGVKHTVKQGDTIASIAKKYNASAADIADYNNLSVGESLAVGQEIIVPAGEVSTPSSTSSNTSGSSSSSCGIKISHYERLLVNPCKYPSYRDYYIRPIVGGLKTQELHGYNAVDLGGIPVGTSIMAAADGVVTVSRTGGYNGGYGTYVVISHPNGTQTVYGHMSANYVEVGQHVSQGDLIGRVGRTGNTTGPHVHFEIRGARNPF